MPRRLGNHPLPGLMASGPFGTPLAFGPRTGPLWRYVPDTFRARLAIQANRPLLNPNTRHAQRLRSCTSCPAGKPYNRSRLRFYIRPNRGWSPSRHPLEFFLRKEIGLQLPHESRSWCRIPLLRVVSCREQLSSAQGRLERALRRGIRWRGRVKLRRLDCAIWEKGRSVRAYRQSG